jgi:hypothetical protein
MYHLAGLLQNPSMTSRFLVGAVAATALLTAQPIFANGHTAKSTSSHAHKTATTKPSSSKGRATSTTPRSSSHTSSATSARASRCTGCERDAHGRILRSSEAKDAFKRATGYPHGRSGYVIDHITPLACGGADAPTNMQWQTTAAAKAKDHVERKGCGK